MLNLPSLFLSPAPLPSEGLGAFLHQVQADAGTKRTAFHFGTIEAMLILSNFFSTPQQQRANSDTLLPSFEILPQQSMSNAILQYLRPFVAKVFLEELRVKNQSVRFMDKFSLAARTCHIDVNLAAIQFLEPIHSFCTTTVASSLNCFKHWLHLPRRQVSHLPESSDHQQSSVFINSTQFAATTIFQHRLELFPNSFNIR
ncbi:MAG: hypothetical protein IPI00_06380 [Flavobacteriales bacterium]|nr:hypothetical protein [Flavobacteriales bacterium]